ncbi:nudix hydrolase 16, mitochondrial-like isoform X2 [Phaseolus vulgaris]|uniref:nudix hydrolase 16, mitochondrial-like isoform X2 n=1 Tax=Phaseolus vulgaris TaxID=3885 RepID=UPI0035CAB57C
MSELVARTGRHQQRYENGYRLVAGYKSSDGDSSSEKIVEVLLINSPSGPGLLFPKGGWENDETVEEAAAREAVEEAGVRGDLMVKIFSTVEFIFLSFCTVTGLIQYLKKIVLSECFNGF